MGFDIVLEDACNLSLCMLVGRLSYRNLCHTSLEDWVTANWEPLLDYSLKIQILLKAWYGFRCRKTEQTIPLLGKLWVMDGRSLMIKRWRVNLDLSCMYFHLQHLSVLLPGLTFHLWNKRSLGALGNNLGRFITVDDQALKAPDKRLCKVLVEINLHAGLSYSIEIEWRGHLKCQRLDCLGVPFHFS